MHPMIAIARLISRIQPRPGELWKASTHSLTVHTRLSKSFNLKRFTRIGSHSRGSAIRTFSDVDFLAVLERNEAKWGGAFMNSSTLLRKVREDLQDRYTHTSVRRDMQAVVVEFGGGQHSMDVVPAVFSKFLPKYGPIYLIPDGYDDWIETSPDSHNKYIRVAKVKSGMKMTKVSQLLKWWKYSRANPIPIQSFHMDMLLATSGICNGIKSYTRCLYEAFELLVTRECRGLRDPLGICDIIYASTTEAQVEDVNEAANYALQHAEAAIIAESKRNYEEANRQWGIVFNWQI